MSGFCARCIPKWVWALGAVGFLAAMWGGSALVQPAVIPKPPPPPPPIRDVQPIFIIFDAYDTQGNEIAPNQVVIKGPAPFDNNILGVRGAQQSQNPGTVINDVIYTYKGHEFHMKVEWQLADDYKKWVENELPKRLAQIDANYNKEKWKVIAARLSQSAVGYKHNYAVIVPAKP